MKNKMLSILLTLSVMFGCFSNFSVVSYAAVSGTYKQNVVEPYATGDKVVSILASGWSLAADRDYETTYTNLRYFTGLNDFGDGAYHNYSGYQSSGADNEYLYSGSYSSSSNQYSYHKVINTTNNSYYNPITNTYTTNNNSIYYNTENNTYLFEGDEYNTYITNNITYVSYYIINNSTSESTYHEIYYQLPDGRNSYDLTADDVWGKYFIYNAVNYDEVLEDDGYTKALYHFDGNLKNSAAVNVNQQPTPSVINYQSGRFDSALVQNVVNSTQRDFIFPSVSASTVDFWVYYSSLCYDQTGAPRSFSNVYTTFFAYENGTYTYYSIPTDVWVHIAIRYNSSLSTNSKWELYINGIYVGNCTYSNLYNIVYDNSSPGARYCCSSFGIDELRITSGKKLFDTSGFTPMSQPYDTNLVLVLPESANINDIAVKSNTPVLNMRVGGVRPTFPLNGDVYVYLENDIVKDVQQYQTDGWYSVDASIYEYDSWVTLKDKDLSSYTITEDDFSSTDNPSDEDNENTDEEDKDETTGLLSSIMEKITGFFTGLLDVLFGGILDLITVITDNLTGIIDGFTDIIGLLGDLFGFLPQEMISVLTSGLAVIIIVVIIKIFI